MGFILAIFGLVTLFMSSSVIFDLFGIREKEGNYILFIVLANFFCAFIYLYASYCFFKKDKRATVALLIAVGILVVAYIGMVIHIQSGKPFETKTIKAMLFRTCLTMLFVAISWYQLNRINFKVPDANDGV
jgi:hypothetical protein